MNFRLAAAVLFFSCALAPGTFAAADAPPDAGRVARAVVLSLHVDGVGRVSDIAVVDSSGDPATDRAAADSQKRAAYPPALPDWTRPGADYLQVVRVLPWSGEIEAGPLIDPQDHAVILISDGFIQLPEDVRRSRAEGKVVVDVAVGPRGAVEGAHVTSSSGNQELDDAALQAARSARYLAAVRGGDPVAAIYVAYFEFDVHVIQAT